MKNLFTPLFKNFFILMIILFFILPVFAVEQPDVKVEIKIFQEEYPALVADLQIPIFTGFSNQQIQEKINQKIEQDIYGFLNQLVEDSNEYLKIAQKEGWDSRKYTAQNNFQFHYLSSKVLSFSIIYYYYTLGAHGMTEQVSYNFDLGTAGESIQIGDLFINYSQYKELINQEIKRQILAEKELYFNEGADFKSISEDQPFYLEYDGLTAYFGLYELAPFAFGICYFKLPFGIFPGLSSDNLKYFGNH